MIEGTQPNAKHMNCNSGHTRDDWSFPTSLFGWNRQRPSNIHVTTNRS